MLCQCLHFASLDSRHHSSFMEDYIRDFIQGSTKLEYKKTPCKGFEGGGRSVKITSITNNLLIQLLVIAKNLNILDYKICKKNDFRALLTRFR